MPLILAIEPDRRQAAQLTSLVRHRVRAELVLADTTEAALGAIGDRVPDLVLVPALLSPSDDAALATALRVIAAAAHVQMLTIPVLAGQSRGKPRVRGMLSALLGGREDTALDGCDPSVFAEQISEYLERAAQERGTESAIAGSADREAYAESAAVAHPSVDPAFFEPETIDQPFAAQPDADHFVPEPAFAESAFAEPVVTEPAYAEPAYTEPTYTEPDSTEPTYATSEYTEPSYAERVFDENTAFAERVVAEPAFADPAFSETAFAAEAAFAEPAVVEPAEVERPFAEPFVEQTFGEHSFGQRFVDERVVEPEIVKPSAYVRPFVDPLPEVEHPATEERPIVTHTRASRTEMPVLDEFLAALEASPLSAIEEVAADGWTEADMADPVVEELTTDDIDLTAALDEVVLDTRLIEDHPRQRHAAAGARDFFTKPEPRESGEPLEKLAADEPQPFESFDPVKESPARMPHADVWVPTSFGAGPSWPRLECRVAEQRPEALEPVEESYTPPARVAAPATPPAAPSRAPAAVPTPVPAPAASGAREQTEWVELVASLRADIERLKSERQPAKATAAPAAPPRKSDQRQQAQTQRKSKVRTKKVQPVQDEWGFFDPEQCGFAALLAKLEEITEEPEKPQPRKR